MNVPHLLLSLLGLFFIAVTLPLVVELLLLSLAAALPARRPVPAAALSSRLAVVIPAHNEETLIAACVNSLRTAGVPGADILVIAHNCTDRTAARATAAGATALVLNDTAGGKGAALDHGFAHALASGAGGVLVIDADSTISTNLPGAVMAALASGSEVVQCRYIAANAGATTRTRLLSLSLLGMNVLRPRGRARLGLSCGIFGNGFALSAATLRRVPYVANSVVEDLEYHLLLVQAGIRVDFLDAASVFGELPDSTQGSSTQRARWEGGRLLMRRRWSRPLLRQVLTGHLRMTEPLLDLLSLPIASGAGLLFLAAFLPIHWLREYAAVGGLAILLYVAVSASLGESPAQTLMAVATAPAYMLWKLTTRGNTRRIARGDATWVRTERNADANDDSNSK